MSDLPLRAACEHGRYETHLVAMQGRLGKLGVRWKCGGREVTDKELIERAGAAAIAEGFEKFPPYIVGPTGERW